MTTLYVTLAFASGLAFYRYVLDKPDVQNVFKRFKQKKTNGSQQIIDNNYQEDASAKCFIEISASMSWGEVKRLARERWKSIKNL
jgi:hypothetical protein